MAAATPAPGAAAEKGLLEHARLDEYLGSLRQHEPKRKRNYDQYLIKGDPDSTAITKAVKKRLDVSVGWDG